MNTRTMFFSLLTILCLGLSTTSLADIYNNGPTNGTVVALYISSSSQYGEQAISDGFVASTSGVAGSLDFAEWVLAGANPTSVAWALGTSSFASDIASGTASVSAGNMTDIMLCHSGDPFNGGICGGGYDYDIYITEVNGLSGLLLGGSTYYLTLSDATDSADWPWDAWDVNDGPATCFYETGGSGSGPCEPFDGSESFTISGSSTTTTSTTGEPVPEPSTILLFGSGILGLAGGLRRMLHF